MHRSEKGKQSKRMNAISLDNSLHFSGSPFAFLGIFSLDRETPNSEQCHKCFSLAHSVPTRIALWDISRRCTPTTIAHCTVCISEIFYRVEPSSEIYQKYLCRQSREQWNILPIVSSRRRHTEQSSWFSNGQWDGTWCIVLRFCSLVSEYCCLVLKSLCIV